MTESGGKKVVFRIAGVGFSLDVDTLVEIREFADIDLDISAADPERDILGQIAFRDETIPLVDIRRIVGLPPADDPVVVIVFGTDGAWAFAIETIVGIAQASEFQACDVPALLLPGSQRLFSTLDIWRSEPLVSFEPVQLESFRGLAQ